MTTSQNQSLADILNEIESRAKAATPGPWRDGQEGNLRVYGPDGQGEHSGLIGVIYKGRGNAAFIASARTDLPKLVKALREACDFYEAEVGHGSFEHGNLQKRLAAILTSPENGEEQQKSLGEPGAV